MMRKTIFLLLLSSVMAFSACYSNSNEPLPGFSSETQSEASSGSLEEYDGSQQILQDNGNAEDILENWENTFPEREGGDEYFNHYLYDATGLYTESDLSALRTELENRVEEIASVLYEEYDAPDFIEKFYEYVDEKSRILDISLDGTIEKIPDGFGLEEINMEVTGVDIDYLETFFAAVPDTSGGETLYEQANIYAFISLEGSSRELPQGQYTGMLSLHFNREPLQGREWTVTFLGGDFFYITDGNPQGYIRTENGQSIVHYDGTIVDNWSVTARDRE